MSLVSGRGKKALRRNPTQTALRQTSKLQKARQKESVTDPFYLARVFLDAEHRDNKGEVILRFWRSEWYGWTAGRYVKTEDAGMRVALTGFIKRFYDENRVVDKQGDALIVRQGIVNDSIAALRSMVAVPDDAEQPMWLNGEQRGPFIALTNGLMDISKLALGEVEVVENSPLWFSQVAIPHPYRPGAKCPPMDCLPPTDAGRRSGTNRFSTGVVRHLPGIRPNTAEIRGRGGRGCEWEVRRPWDPDGPPWRGQCQSRPT